MATEKSFEFIESALTTTNNGCSNFYLPPRTYIGFTKWCEETGHDELLDLLQHQEQPDGRIKIWL